MAASDGGSAKHFRKLDYRGRTRTRGGHGCAFDRHALGSTAERVVRHWLEARGIHVLAANVRVNYLEIDLLVQDGRTLAIVEVRTRSPGSWTSAFGSIDGWKRTRLRRAGERLWRRKFRFRQEFDHLRFDVASVTWSNARAHVEYIRAAF